MAKRAVNARPIGTPRARGYLIGTAVGRRRSGSDMTYFVTGATGFIGGHLVGRLLARKGDIYCLLREGSLDKFEALQARFGAKGKRLIAVPGNLAKPSLGLAPA